MTFDQWLPFVLQAIGAIFLGLVAVYFIVQGFIYVVYFIFQVIESWKRK